MPIKNYIQIIIVFTIISSISLITIIFKMDPLDKNFGYISIILFYLSFLLTLFGIFTSINILTRKIFANELLNNKILNISIRQGFLMGFYVIVLLFLYDIDVFSWTNIILITIIMILSEIYFWD